MAEGLSAYAANKVLDALGNNVSFVVAAPYVKLHIGAVGALGLTNAATETTRKLVSFGVSASGIMLNDVAITWTNIAGSQDATHFSAWDDVAAGNFLFSGTITANAYTAGDTYDVAIGAMSVSLTIAS